jgi:hypothetical protein
MSGAQKVPVNPGTVFVVQEGGLVNTGGPADQKTWSAEDFELMPEPVEKM